MSQPAAVQAGYGRYLPGRAEIKRPELTLVNYLTLHILLAYSPLVNRQQASVTKNLPVWAVVTPG